MTIEPKTIPFEDRSKSRDSMKDSTAQDRDDARSAARPAPAVSGMSTSSSMSTDGTAHSEYGTPYLPDQASTQTGEQWQRIQADFVNDPRKSVSEAHQLVSNLVQRIVDGFTKERGELERQWSEGDEVSTEDLRVCLQRYRAFFARLLPSANGLASNTGGGGSAESRTRSNPTI